jgi:hypothetical protein
MRAIFRAKKDKKGKKGQEDLREFLAPFCPSCPFLLFKHLPIPRMPENELA